MNFLIIREGGKPLVPSVPGAPGPAQIHAHASLFLSQSGSGQRQGVAGRNPGLLLPLRLAVTQVKALGWGSEPHPSGNRRVSALRHPSAQTGRCAFRSAPLWRARGSGFSELEEKRRGDQRPLGKVLTGREQESEAAGIGPGSLVRQVSGLRASWFASSPRVRYDPDPLSLRRCLSHLLVFSLRFFINVYNASNLFGVPGARGVSQRQQDPRDNRPCQARLPYSSSNPGTQ